MRLVDDPGRRRARSFAGVADGYDYARPSYRRLRYGGSWGPDHSTCSTSGPVPES